MTNWSRSADPPAPPPVPPRQLRLVVFFWMFGGFFGLGTLMSAAIFSILAYQGYRERYVYLETKGVVQATRLRDELVFPKPTPRRRGPPVEHPPYFVYHPEIQVSYAAAGQSHTQWIDVAHGGNQQDRALMSGRQAAFSANATIPVYYDPGQADRATLHRGDGGLTMLIVGLVVVAIAGSLSASMIFLARGFHRMLKQRAATPWLRPNP